MYERSFPKQLSTLVAIARTTQFSRQTRNTVEQQSVIVTKKWRRNHDTINPRGNFPQNLEAAITKQTSAITLREFKLVVP